MHDMLIAGVMPILKSQCSMIGHLVAHAFLCTDDLMPHVARCVLHGLCRKRHIAVIVRNVGASLAVLVTKA